MVQESVRYQMQTVHFYKFYAKGGYSEDSINPIVILMCGIKQWTYRTVHATTHDLPSQQIRQVKSKKKRRQ